MSVQRPERTIRPSADEVGGMISCTICHAVYTPDHSHEYLTLAPSIALESAFMSMCHFCFRCRRPACPGCWDDVHGICGECAQETRLPFRTAAGPLGALLFTSSRQAQLERERSTSEPLVCVRSGNFHVEPPIEKISTRPERMDGQDGQRTREIHGTPIEERVVRKPKAVVSISGRKRVERPEAAVIIPGKRRATSREQNVAARADRGVPGALSGRSKHFFGVVERLLTILLSLILCIVIVMIVVASLSENANALIASTLHVDIRAEIAYLWQLITHLR